MHDNWQLASEEQKARIAQIQAQTEAIETLSKLRLEKAKLENERTGSDAVDDWIAAVLGEEAESYE